MWKATVRVQTPGMLPGTLTAALLSVGTYGGRSCKRHRVQQQHPTYHNFDSRRHAESCKRQQKRTVTTRTTGGDTGPPWYGLRPP
eukprot:7385650-Prymnesium_polylepis.1